MLILPILIGALGECSKFQVNVKPPNLSDHRSSAPSNRLQRIWPAEIGLGFSSGSVWSISYNRADFEIRGDFFQCSLLSCALIYLYIAFKRGTFERRSLIKPLIPIKCLILAKCLIFNNNLSI